MVRWLFVALAVAAAPGPARAEWFGLRGFDLPNLIWAATHIVLAEDGKVVESWAGDLKPGAKVPYAPAAYARLRPPDFDPGWVKRAGGKAPAVTGRRKVLFLAHAPAEGQEDRGPVWMGADHPGRPAYPPSSDSVAWVEGDRVYLPGGLDQEWPDGRLAAPGPLAGLKERVGLGRDLRARFDAARADPDPGKRADRLGALAPAVVAYADRWGTWDAIQAARECGAAAVPHLARWATESKGNFRYDAWQLLCGTGDAGVDAVLQVLDDQVGYWKGAADRLKPGQTGGDLPGDPRYPWAGNGLYHLLEGVHAMRLSADNRKRVREHPALAELDRLLGAHPGLKAGLVRMDAAHRRLRDIRAGHFRPAD